MEQKIIKTFGKTVNVLIHTFNHEENEIKNIFGWVNKRLLPI